jgi:hypothetical protein
VDRVPESGGDEERLQRRMERFGQRTRHIAWNGAERTGRYRGLTPLMRSGRLGGCRDVRQSRSRASIMPKAVYAHRARPNRALLVTLEARRSHNSRSTGLADVVRAPITLHGRQPFA